jgi:hypothetical protein
LLARARELCDDHRRDVPDDDGDAIHDDDPEWVDD